MTPRDVVQQIEGIVSTDDVDWFVQATAKVEAFKQAVERETREQCALVAEEHDECGACSTGDRIARAIRLGGLVTRRKK